VSLRQIAEATKLSVGALEALERDDISRLPGGIFSRAFVRSYAVEVGMDPEKTVQDFIAQFPHDSVTQGSPHVPPVFDDDASDRRRRAGVIAMALVLIVLVGAAILYVVSLR
jgi:cytoskeletal protein RodZ